jgi:phosphoadenosine phosphosulfate reductase
MTEQDIPLEIYWCDDCKAPITKHANDIDKSSCPVCKQTTTYLCADLRPVFPEERLLLEVMQGKPLTYLEKSVWAAKNRYYIDGKPSSVTVSSYNKLSPNKVLEKLEGNKEKNSYAFFNANIKKFIELNKTRLHYIVDEAFSFVKDTSSPYPRENIVISFSGGKDSTVAADLAMRALGDPA